MLKLKLQYFGHLLWRADSFEKTLMLGKIKGRKRRGWQRMRCLDGITDLMNMSLSRLWELVMDRETCRALVHGVQKSCTRLNDWTEMNESRLATTKKKKKINNAFPSISSSCKLVGKKKLHKNCHKCIILWNASTTKTEVRIKSPEVENITSTLLKAGLLGKQSLRQR